ncbi:UvrD-helicase domain-containing protein [Riemerella anatipestifer]|nr:UvrD-helicase domain-containing protein [Riemerella anatipestifer]
MHSYNAISASAGSGKTYTLVIRILSLCLRTPDEKAIRYILALTFTNKAANEMKERILQWLEAFTREDYLQNNELKAIQSYLETQGIKLTIEDLHYRSKKVLDYILHHYSILNIGTIDKFNAKLVRSFSYELGLAQNFNLEINNEPYLIEAVDQLLDKIGEDPKVSEAFMDFVNYNLENEERINVNKTLYDRAKTFVNDVHYEELRKNEAFDWETYDHLKLKLRTQLTQHHNEALQYAKKALALISENNLEIKDFQGGASSGLGKFFEEALKFYTGQRDKFPFPSDEEKALERFRKGTASKDNTVINAIFSILDTLIEWRTLIITNYVTSEKKAKILKELLPLKINKEIREQLEIIEDEDDLVLLSKFNILIKENLREEPSAFIYEKIGTRYQHYFFDEFQDTSKLQWENIIPLRDHTISSEDHSFTLVGDPKQSIYRFRGGDAEQMLDIINGKEATGVDINLENLENNWRSAQNIVRFNNELYAFMAKDLEQEEHRHLFAEQGQQIAKREDLLGRVRVNLVEYDRKDEVFFDEVANQMFEDIKICLNNGFQFSDICIMCRTKGEIKQLSQRLGLLKVNYKNTETYIKTISEKGLSLDLSKTLLATIEYLKWENDTANYDSLMRALYHLNSLGRININLFSEEMTSLLELKTSDAILEELNKRYGIKLNHQHYLHLNLYNRIEYLVKQFAIPQQETDFILNFLEEVYAFTQNPGKTLKDFIKYWDEEASEKSIQSSENIDAIKMMTIHATKGLEYPVVFLPMKNSHKDSSFNDWLSVDLENLKSVNLSQFKKELLVYDDTLKSFSDENTYKNKIDRYCVQYVATTRPVEQLFLYLQKPSQSGENKLEILDFVQQFNASDHQFDLYPEENNSYQKQNRKKKPTEINKQNVEITPNTCISSNIQIATPSKTYQERNKKVRTGIFTHEILSKIKTKNDITPVLSSYLIDGIITKQEKAEIEKTILSVVEHHSYSFYFEDIEEVYNERDFMLNGEIFRPDRVVKKNGGYYILDFKTGAPNDKHQNQILAYKTALEQLSFNVSGTEIVYI